MARTLVCVPLFVDDLDEAQRDAALARDLGADVIEWRIDELVAGVAVGEAAQAASRLLRESPLPSFLTCRSAREGGHFHGSGDEVATLLDEVKALAPSIEGHVDLEMAMLEDSARLRERCVRPHEAGASDGPRVILSHHELEGRPARLFELLKKMRAHEGATVLKLAWTGRTVRDNLEAFEILLERDRPTIVLVMGEAGLMSRVLSAKFGGFLTFAALREGAGTAPGQPTIRELLDVYRFRSLGPATKTYGIVGWPVAHSISPQVHNACFEALGVNAVYLPLPVAPGWESFKATVLSLLDWRPLDLRGLSVTIPHKEHLVRLAREDSSRAWTIDPLADQLGAANTLAVSEEGICRVTNTDVTGIVEPLRAATRARGRGLSGAQVAVFGAGGAARAAAAGLAVEGAQVHVYARRVEQAERVARELSEACQRALESSGGSISARPWVPTDAPEGEIFVNCTPVGLAGTDTKTGRWISDVALDRIAQVSEESLVFDTVYRPFMTPTLRAAEARKLRVIPGLSMFVAQAAAQFELWTGHPAPRELIDRTGRETLQAQGA